MSPKIYKLVLWVMCMMTVGAMSCSDTDIPQTPEAPFAVSRIWIMNDGQPPFGTLLTAGANVTFDFQVAYALSEDDANRAGLQILVDFEFRDINDVAFELGVDPDGLLDLTESSDVISGSFPFAIPSNATAIDMFVEIHDVNGALLQDIRVWLVQ
jgi:hypothetical protein